MPRRTINLPDSVDELIRGSAAENESFSAAVARLVEAGARHGATRPRPSYVATGDGPEDLGRRAEQYLREPVDGR